MEVNSSVLAENIKKYLSQGVSIKEIYINAQNFGVSEKVWNEAVNIILSQKIKISPVTCYKKIVWTFFLTFFLVSVFGFAGWTYLGVKEDSLQKEKIIKKDIDENLVEASNQELSSIENEKTIKEDEKKEDTSEIKNQKPDFEIRMKSDKGEFIGQGKDWSFSSKNSKLLFQKVLNEKENMSFSIKGPNVFSFEFSSGKGTILSPGLYSPAKRNGFHGDYNGISIDGDGRGCNTILGAFYIHEYEVKNKVLQKAAIDFIQTCGVNINKKLYGSFRYNSDIPNSCEGNDCEKVKELVVINSKITTEITAMPVNPLFQIHTKSAYNDSVGKGELWHLSNNESKITVIKANEDKIKFSVNNKYHFNFEFSSAKGTILSPGLYAPARRNGFRGNYNGISITGKGRGCNTILGAFYVHEYEVKNEVLQKAAIDFVQSCGNDKGKLYGSLRYNSDIKDSCDYDGCPEMYKFLPNNILLKKSTPIQTVTSDTSFNIRMESNISGIFMPEKKIEFFPKKGSTITIKTASPEMVDFEIKDFYITSWLRFKFSSPKGKIIRPGLYSPAKPTVHPNEYNGMRIEGNGRGGCGQGAFYVHEYVLEKEQLKRAAIDFVQYCGRDKTDKETEGFHYGSIRYNSDIPSSCDNTGCQKVKEIVPINSVKKMIPSLVSDKPQFKIMAEIVIDGLSPEILSYSSSDNLKLKPMNVSNSGINFDLYPFNSQPSFFKFVARKKDKFDSELYIKESSNGVDLSALFKEKSQYCSLTSGRFYVHEYAIDGKTLQKAAIDFVQYCEATKETIYGSIRYGSDIPLSCNNKGCENIKEKLNLQ